MSNTSWIERYVMPAALRIAGQKHVLSVRDGIILNMPFMLIGSFFLIFAYLPIPGYADMMSGLFGEVWRDKMLYPVKATYDIMALISSFGIAYRLAEKYRTLDPLSAGAMSLVAFMMTIPQNTLFTPVHGAAEVIKGVIPVSMVGSGGCLSPLSFRCCRRRFIVWSPAAISLSACRTACRRQWRNLSSP